MIAWLAALPPNAAKAGDVINRIKTDQTIRCGGAPRPGLVVVAPDGRASGLYLDVCRAIGAALLGPEGKIEFHQYDSDKAFDAVRNGGDDVFFLNGSDMIDMGLAGKVTPGPAVFIETTAVMVPGGSPAHSLADLAGQSICFFQGANAHRNLEAWFAAHHLDFVRMGYQEYVELFDTYDARVCRAQAGESTALAAARLTESGRRLQSRILPEPLAVLPIVAATSTQDAQWSAIVAWALDTLQRAEIPAKPWAAGGLDALPIKAPELGLAPDWQKRVIGAAGTYDEIFARNLGAQSPLKLPRGLNAPWEQGGLFAPPFLE
jgi:general L-amino acid transport system substrate-binding protein